MSAEMVPVLRQVVKVDGRKRVIQGVPASLFKMAKRAEKRPDCITASNYYDTVRMLFENKGLSWPEIHEWFARRGVHYAKGTLTQIYRKGRGRVEIRDAVRALAGLRDQGVDVMAIAKEVTATK